MRRSQLADDLARAMGRQPSTLCQVIFDFLGHETNRSPHLDKWQSPLAQVEDCFDADMKKFSDLSRRP
jgi:hypothetical protein